MAGHEHIVTLINCLKADNDRDIYLVFEIMETDLHAAIRANILQDIHKQYIIWQARAPAAPPRRFRPSCMSDARACARRRQTLKALKYMHSADLLHRDMKPSNLLLNSDCLMKARPAQRSGLLAAPPPSHPHRRDRARDAAARRRLRYCPTVAPSQVADFGLARSMTELRKGKEDAPVLTDYVATRWYRAPEILLGSTAYSLGVDMWSVGCILGEMLSGKPVFPGSSTIDQLQKVMELTGYPTDAEVASMRSPYAATMLESLPTMAPAAADRWQRRFPGASADAIELMKALLAFDPAQRPSAEQALAHPYVAQFHDLAAEKVAERKVEMVIDDNVKKTTAVYREMLYHVITKMKRRNKELKQQHEEQQSGAH